MISRASGKRSPSPEIALISALLVASTLFSPLLTFADSHPEPSLSCVRWELSFLGDRQPGLACWILGPDGAFRAEILPYNSGPANLHHLLTQTGQGFSVILNGLDGGTFNQWGNRWRELDSRAVAWLSLLVRTIASGGGQSGSATGEFFPLADLGSRSLPGPGFLFPAAEYSQRSTYRFQLPALERFSSEAEAPSQGMASSSYHSFRTRMAARSSGRGGDQEILTLISRLSDARQPWWTLTSSRKPGRLDIQSQATWTISEPGLEVFTPLWPLDSLVELKTKKLELPPGTHVE